ncbi:hypothetical protein PDE_08754 [Penicillium oxalicum 114-2]|uniref:Aminoglycoside phosphotransferase domain-containing protein n=1 Tax=Penicillium oxalicum (strain 114-2 / CGMCC 5302) TaxID=933388 RepID=S8BFC5_PENO1|nr:hypothetical protein PDE_08754 [Penicillium oxalicum 114-2]
MELEMLYDDVAWEQSDDISETWLLQFLDIDVKRPIAMFIWKHNSGDDPVFAILRKGSFNITLQMKYTHNAINIRFSQPGAILFPEEKTQNEVAVMRYLSDQTQIPVPFVLRSGTRVESPLNLSPFIMMSHIEHTTTMYDALNTPGCPSEKRGSLDPNINENQLKLLYTELAKVVLQLYRTEFSKIGSLNQVDDFSWEINSRPVSMNMNELVRLGTLPRSKLPSLGTTSNTTSSYIEALGQLNIQHLLHQRNDAIKSADDCRRKFVARQLFLKLAREKKLSLSSHESGPFKLWCDDFRPGNILLNHRIHIAGVVDWEFAYAAPVEFSQAPPWWLLIERPEKWSEGIEDWTRVFDHRLKTFLAAMKACEDTDPQLPEQMQQSWDSGDFWVIYALLNSFAFDTIYWLKIDRRFFGPTGKGEPGEAWKERLILLNDDQRAEMEELVTRKLEEMETRVLAWDPDEYTEGFRQEFKRRREAQEKEGGEPHQETVEESHEEARSLQE